MASPTEEITPVWKCYLDLPNDVKPWLQFPTTDTARDRPLQLVTDMACTWVQNYLGRPIAPTEFFRRFSGYYGTGNGGAYLALPYYPILTTQTSSTYSMTVVEYWGTSGAHTLVEQTPTQQGTQDVYSLDTLRGYVIRAFMGLVPRPFFPGLRNVEVTWWAGYDPVPADIRVATLELIAYWWRNTQQASRQGPVLRGMEGEYDSEDPATKSALWPAVPHRIVALLEPYTQIGIG